jgi:hypothetical protein
LRLPVYGTSGADVIKAAFLYVRQPAFLACRSASLPPDVDTRCGVRVCMQTLHRAAAS